MFKKLFSKGSASPSYSRPEKTVFFLHIPKTAGGTLCRIVNKNYPESAVYEFNPVATHTEAHFRGLSASEKDRFDCIKGHFYFGLHQYHPRPAAYITMLRDPVDRMLSHYYYVLKTPIHYLHEKVTSAKMTLEDYVTSDLTEELENGQLRMIAGVEGMPLGQCTRELLEKGKQNLLQHFSLVGVSEHFDDFLCGAQQVLGWKHITYERANVNESRRSRKDIPETTLKLIRERNQLDIELYDFVRSTFDSLGKRRNG